MSLAIKPDDLDYDESNDSTDMVEDIFSKLFDPDHIEQYHGFLPGVSTLHNETTTFGSTAGTDNITALRWQYEDKVAVLALVLGSEWNRGACDGHLLI